MALGAQELRGNIRVMVRVRPFLGSDGYDVSETAPESQRPASALTFDPNDQAQLVVSNCSWFSPGPSLAPRLLNWLTMSFSDLSVGIPPRT